MKNQRKTTMHGIINRKDVAFCRKHLKSYKKQIINEHKAPHLSLLPVYDNRAQEIADILGLDVNTYYFNFEFDEYYSYDDKINYCHGFNLRITPKKEPMRIIESVGHYVDFSRPIKLYAAAE